MNSKGSLLTDSQQAQTRAQFRLGFGDFVVLDRAGRELRCGCQTASAPPVHFAAGA